MSEFVSPLLCLFQSASLCLLVISFTCLLTFDFAKGNVSSMVKEKSPGRQRPKHREPCV